MLGSTPYIRPWPWHSSTLFYQKKLGVRAPFSFWLFLFVSLLYLYLVS